MIEIRKPKKRFQIYIDGEHQHDTSVEHQLAKGGVDGYRINSRSWFFYESIQPYKISDFPNLIQLSFFLMVDWAKVKFWVSIIKSKNFDELYNVRFRVDVSKLKIDSEFSNYFKVFSSKIAELNENNNHFRIIITRLDDISFYLNFDKMPLSMTIGKELEYCLDILEDVHNRVLLTLDSKTQISTFTIGFDFPEKLKTSCEQYLQYFKQFLLDLGIQTSSELKDEAGKVLFSITPTEDIEALDKIREALAIYLNLPASPIVYDNSFAAMRLQQQIENLQHSQKMAVR